MGSTGLERGFGVVVGTVLVVLGLAGSFGNPIVGAPGEAMLVTGAGHDLMHLVAGALYIHVGLVLSGRHRANALVILGAVFVVSGVVSLLGPELFGFYGAPASPLDQLGHVAIGAASIVVGWMGRMGPARQPRRRASRPVRG